MNYVILGLGILLTIAGCLSLSAGYDIIEIERGWAEVIAGATAASAGIITIALSMILLRLSALGELYKAAQSPAPSRSTFAPVMFADEVMQAVPPKHKTFARDAPPEAAPALSSAPPLVMVSEPAPEHKEPEQIAAFAESEAETRVGDLNEIEAPLLEPVVEPAPVNGASPRDENPIREKMKAVFRRNTGLRRPLTKPAPIERVVEPKAALPDALMAATVPELLPSEEPVSAPSLPKASAPTLSLDEMWKRVSIEIEEPIFPAPSKSFALAPEIKISDDVPCASAPDPHVETLSTATEVPALSVTAIADDHHTETAGPLLDSHSPAHDEYDAPMDNASRLPRVFSDFASAPVPAPAVELRRPVLEEPEYRPEPEPNMPPRPALESVPAAPAIIGRYEAEGTAYLMFADGSIEAQSEAGVFNFASMADLKAFLETKQAAGP